MPAPSSAGGGGKGGRAWRGHRCRHPSWKKEGKGGGKRSGEVGKEIGREMEGDKRGKRTGGRLKRGRGGKEEGKERK